MKKGKKIQRDVRIVSITLMSVLLLTGVMLVQTEEYWLTAMPLLVLCCSPFFVRLVVFSIYFLRTRIEDLIKTLSLLVKVFTPIFACMSFALAFTLNHAEKLGFGSEASYVLGFGIFCFSYAGHHIVMLAKELSGSLKQEKA